MTAIPVNYVMPVLDGGLYTKIEDGQSIDIRVISTITTGWQYFNTESKPVRSKEKPENPTDIRLDGKYGKEKPKHIWAVPVYNYTTGQVEIFTVSQVGIQRALLSLEQNKKWGDLLDYDVTIKREKVGDKTNYLVTPNKPETLTEEVAMAIATTKVDVVDYINGGTGFGE
jgi:hypothetical protein